MASAGELTQAEMRTRVVPLIWIGAAAILLLLALADAVPGEHRGAILAIAGLALIIAAALFLVRDRLPERAWQALPYLAFLYIGALIVVAGEPGTPLALFYLWLVVQSAYFESRRQALAQGVFAAATYALALALTTGSGFPWAQWLMLTATMFAVGVPVASLHRRISEMITRLDDLAGTDELTGLGNRRRLMAALDRACARPDLPKTVALYDLDGFKLYNDTYGHPAGDALLARIAGRAAAALGDGGEVYRLGGDEFCAVLGGEEAARRRRLAALDDAFSERGEGFRVRASRGLCEVPGEADGPSAILTRTDRRLYRAKAERGIGARVARGQLEGLANRRLAALAREVGAASGLQGEQLDVLVRAAALRDIGKLAIPEELLDGQPPLGPKEREFLRGYVMIGERLLDATPPLRALASVVRGAKEHWDGSGYPDGLAGEDIPLASRIVSACAVYLDAGEAGGDSQRSAFEAVRAAAGTELDPVVAETLIERLSQAPSGPGDRPPGAGPGGSPIIDLPFGCL